MKSVQCVSPQEHTPHGMLLMQQPRRNSCWTVSYAKSVYLLHPLAEKHIVLVPLDIEWALRSTHICKHLNFTF